MVTSMLNASANELGCLNSSLKKTELLLVMHIVIILIGTEAWKLFWKKFIVLSFKVKSILSVVENFSKVRHCTKCHVLLVNFHVNIDVKICKWVFSFKVWVIRYYLPVANSIINSGCFPMLYFPKGIILFTCCLFL